MVDINGPNIIAKIEITINIAAIPFSSSLERLEERPQNIIRLPNWTKIAITAPSAIAMVCNLTS